MVSVFVSEKGDPRRLFSINIGTDSREVDRIIHVAGITRAMVWP